jgi:hypothetical protein
MVGLPRLSRISRADIELIADMVGATRDAEEEC